MQCTSPVSNGILSPNSSPKLQCMFQLNTQDTDICTSTFVASVCVCRIACDAILFLILGVVPYTFTEHILLSFLIDPYALVIIIVLPDGGDH